MKTSAFRENILAIGIAAILSFLIVFSIGNLGLLQTSIISPQGISHENSKDVDLVLKGGDANIVSNNFLEDVKGISLTLLINPLIKSFSGGSVSTTLKNAKISFSEEGEGIYTFYIEYEGDIDRGDVILSFPFSGQQKDINIGDIVVSDKIGQGRQLIF